MPHIDSDRRKAPTAAVLVCLLCALLLAACGGSSKGSTSATTSASATAAGGASGSKAAGAGPGRFTALRECLQKNGITLPKRTPGQRKAPGSGTAPGPGGAFRGGSGARLPKGITQAQFQAALKKCGGAGLLGRGRFGAGGAQRYAKFAACMAKNGVKLPAPNTSGKGPIFNTKGIDTTSVAFKSADVKCQRELAGAGAGAPQGAAPGGPPSGPPPGR